MDCLEKNIFEEVRVFSLFLYNMLLRIKFIDFLMEVVYWIGFDEMLIYVLINCLLKGEEKVVFMVVFMVMGINIGFIKMVEVILGVIYY